jgi:putative membrane protein
MRRSGFLALALAAAITVACNDNNRTSADNPSGSAVGTAGDTDRNNVSRGDRDFVNDVTIAGMAEVELGKMAATKASNAEVKKFAQMMVDDHTKAGDQLKTIATQHNIPTPTELDDTHRDLRDRLSKLQGADFDREYMQAMVDGHEDVEDKLGSRVDKAKLAEWHTAAGDHMTGTKVEERGKAEVVVPEKSDNAVTMSINEWAAAAYPTVHMHLVNAKSIEPKVEKGRTPTQ